MVAKIQIQEFKMKVEELSNEIVQNTPIAFLASMSILTGKISKSWITDNATYSPEIFKEMFKNCEKLPEMFKGSKNIQNIEYPSM